MSYKNFWRVSLFNMYFVCILLGLVVLFLSLKFIIVLFISIEKFIKMILGLFVRLFIGWVFNKFC